MDIGGEAVFDSIFLGTIKDDDAIEGSDGVDILHGGAGDDVLLGAVVESGAFAGDIIDGGDGSDTADYSEIERGLVIGLTNEARTAAVTATAEVVVALDAMTVQVDHLFNIETIIGSNLVDTLYLGGGTMNAFSNIEMVDLGENANGDGDIVSLSSFGAGASINLSAPTGGSLFVANAEIVIGSDFNDTIRGGNAAETLDGGEGKDYLAGDIVTGFTTSGTEQDTINLDALFDALNGGISSAARAGRVQLLETGTDVELRIDTAAGTGAGDGVGDVTLMVFAGMTSAAGLSIGTLSTSDIQVGTA